MVDIHHSGRHCKHLQAFVVTGAESVESEIKRPVSRE